MSKQDAQPAISHDRLAGILTRPAGTPLPQRTGKSATGAAS
ncbi:hypothetical protein [Streptomyces malaysiensis]